MMICEARLTPYSISHAQWIITESGTKVAMSKYARPVTIHQISAGQKFCSVDGHVCDVQRHASDRHGIEYEVEFLDMGGFVFNRPVSVDRINNEYRYARFFTSDMDLICDLTNFGINANIALGWKRLHTYKYKIVAWKLER